ncbi:MAG: NUDIX hydrolase N-terminal domain-containing protein [Culicoidibacterales bacterium]
MRDEFLDFIKEVQATAHIGQQYSTDPYALDNYKLLAQSAQRMLASYTENAIEPRDVYIDFEYPTPQPAVRTLVVSDDNKILFVQERDSGYWSLPGGWVDVNSTPSEAAVKEIFEESGYVCELERLVAVFDRNRYLEVQSIYDVLCFYFIGKIVGGAPKPNHETVSVEWFELNDLPPLSRKNTYAEIICAHDIWQKKQETYCE